MNQKAIEQQSLLVSTGMNFIIALAGLLVYILTDLNFLLLDSVFSLIAFLSCLAALFISKHSHRQTDRFPLGLTFLEPLYGLLKSIATLMLLIITLLETGAEAYAYFFQGEGSPMETGPVLPYTLTMVTLCLGLATYNKRQNQKIGGLSTMIEAESRSNLIDGLISLGIAGAMIFLYLVDFNGQLGFLHYTGDFFITAILVAVSIKEPWTTLTSSFKELVRSTTQDDTITRQVLAVFDRQLPAHKEELDILIFKQGMHLFVKARISSAESPEFIELLAEQKAELVEALRQEFDFIQLEFSF